MRKLFRETGSVKRKSGSRTLTKRTTEAVAMNRKLLKRTFLPYKIQSFQELKPPDYAHLDLIFLVMKPAVHQKILQEFLMSLILKDRRVGIFSMTAQQLKQI